ncbi:MAG: hypothetical protein F2712_06015, partial [Actinobacteria bacterium]|nr:hypothetical protein [Actinomycetota bacterium]
MPTDQPQITSVCIYVFRLGCTEKNATAEAATARSTNEAAIPIFGVQSGLVKNSNWFPGLIPTEYLLNAA